MSYNQFQPDGGDGYRAVLGIIILLLILFVFGMAIGLGIGAMT